MIIGSAAFSAAIILLFWDGNTQLLVQRGLIGLLANAALLISLCLFGWPKL